MKWCENFKCGKIYLERFALQLLVTLSKGSVTFGTVTHVSQRESTGVYLDLGISRKGVLTKHQVADGSIQPPYFRLSEFLEVGDSLKV